VFVAETGDGTTLRRILEWRPSQDNMILELSFIGHIGGRVDAGEGSEVVDEMGLVEIAAA
jgi:hypothetical protein